MPNPRKRKTRRPKAKRATAKRPVRKTSGRAGSPAISLEEAIRIIDVQDGEAMAELATR
jgi:hypothetical protein